MTAAVFYLGAAVAAIRLPAPVHMPHDHPDRPDARQLSRLADQLFSSRCLMLSNYMMLPILSALVPGVFDQLGCGVSVATPLLALMDVVRLACFAAMQRSPVWHNKASLLAWTALLLPVGFFMALLGTNLAVVLSGVTLFGLAEGMVYYTALYYAMESQNASVGAAGVHEALIGTGYMSGPLVGLIGTALANATGSTSTGMLLGIGPFAAACGVAALWPLLCKPKRQGKPQMHTDAHR